MKLGEIETLNDQDFKKRSRKIPDKEIILGFSLSTSYQKMSDSIYARLNHDWAVSINAKYFDRDITSSQQTTSTVDESSQQAPALDLSQVLKDAGTSVSRTMSICDNTTIEFAVDINNDDRNFYVDWSYLEEDKVLPLDFEFDKVQTDDGGIKLVPNLSKNPILVMKKRESIEKILKKDKLAKCSDGGENKKRNLGFKPITEPGTQYWICELSGDLTNRIYQNKIFDDKFLHKLSTAAESFTQSPSTGSPNNRDDGGSEQDAIQIPKVLQQNTPILPSLLRQILGFKEIFEVTVNKEGIPLEARFSGEISEQTGVIG